jgi:hypothetical protein
MAQYLLVKKNPVDQQEMLISFFQPNLNNGKKEK